MDDECKDCKYQGDKCQNTCAECNVTPCKEHCPKQCGLLPND